MLKTTQTGKSSFTLSLALSGLLMLFYAMPKAAAQDAPPQPAPQDQSMPADPNAPPDQAQPRDQAPPRDQAAPQDQPTAQDQAPPMNQAPPPQSQAGYDGSGPNNPNAPDPPSRAARISYLEGSVSFQPGGQGDWGNAVKNRPVTVADKIWSDKGSRAEIQTGPLTLHLGSMTALSFLNLDGNTTQIRIAEGSVNFRVREMREGDIFEIDTPNAAFTVRQAGAFRIDVAENGDGTRVTVIRGAGDVLAGGQTYTVHVNERAEFVGVDDKIQYVVHGAPPPDSLDRWANDRDLREDNSVSARYVNRDVPGYSDLDDHGTWSEQAQVEPGQEGDQGQPQPEGPVWYPNDVPPGWAPYSDGYWNYVGPWGWSWVGYEPWGFAPYHYGRWSFYGGRWGWYPGPIWAAPYYGPAFVGFLGGGFGVGVGFGFGFGGGIGWFPLGCGEPFHPWYHAGFGYVHNINVSNTRINNTVINNNHYNYAYAHNTSAVTAASRSAFTTGERVNRGSSRVSASALQNARVSNNVNVAPTRASYTGSASLSAHVATPPAAVQNRSVVTRTTPSVASRSAVATASRGAASNSTRTWAAQGNTTDRGVAPYGAGRSSAAGNSTQTAHVTQNDRPQWARAGASNSAAVRGSANAATNYNRPPSVSASRASQPTQRATPTYNSNRGSYATAPRTYSAPPRASSAPSRTSSAPAARSGGSSGGASRGGGGGSPHGGGGGSRH